MLYKKGFVTLAGGSRRLISGELGSTTIFGICGPNVCKDVIKPIKIIKPLRKYAKVHLKILEHFIATDNF